MTFPKVPKLRRFLRTLAGATCLFTTGHAGNRRSLPGWDGNFLEMEGWRLMDFGILWWMILLGFLDFIVIHRFIPGKSWLPGVESEFFNRDGWFSRLWMNFLGCVMIQIQHSNDFVSWPFREDGESFRFCPKKYIDGLDTRTSMMWRNFLKLLDGIWIWI